MQLPSKVNPILIYLLISYCFHPDQAGLLQLLAIWWKKQQYYLFWLFG